MLPEGTVTFVSAYSETDTLLCHSLRLVRHSYLCVCMCLLSHVEPNRLAWGTHTKIGRLLDSEVP